MSTSLQATEIKPLAHDDSQFANLLDSAKFEHLWRVSKVFANSQLVPAHFQGKTENCFVAMQMAFRLNVDPFMFLQNCYMVKGKPAVETKLAVALLNASGRIKGPMRYKVQGEGQTLSCTAYCVEASTGEIIEHLLDWKTVVKRGWDKNDQWVADPKLMIQYRAAMRLIRLNFPDVLLGMLSKEESDELNTVEVRPTPVSYAERRRAAIEQQTEPAPLEIVEDEDPAELTDAEIAAMEREE